jgi:AsmA family protein
MKFRGAVDWSDNYWNFDDVELQLGEGFIAVSGGLDGPPSFGRTDLNVELQASSIRNMSVLAGRALPDQPLHLVARLVGTDDVMTLEDFAFTFGASDLQGEFTMRGGDVPTVNIDVSSNLFDISEYLPEPEPEPKQNPEPPPQQKNPDVIPDTPLPLELLRSLNADVAIEISELRTRTLIEKGISVNARLSDGALKIENASLISQRGGYLKLSAELVPDDAGGAEFSFIADGEDLVLGFIAESDEDLQQLPLLAMRAELAGGGATIKDLAGSLDGYFRLVGGEGRIRSGSFSMFTQDFVSEVVNAVNPFAKKDAYTNVECGAVLLQFDGGVVTGKPAFVQQTEKLRIFANTEIDLKTEALAADFKMVPRKGLGISVSGLVNPYIEVTGTLGTPALVVDPESLLIEGGVAVATGGISILAKSFKDRFLSEKDPCGKAVANFDASLERARAAD